MTAPMFRDRANVTATVVLGAGLGYLAFRVVRWAFVSAGWAVIGERFRFILFGSYPFGEQWRPAIVCGLFVALYAASAVRAWWKPWLLGLWGAIVAASLVLMRGGWFGLADVPSEFWGGLPLTFVLSTVGFVAAFPLAVALALGRRSRMPVIRTLSVAYIELVRGVPLITFLFMAAVMFPLFVPRELGGDKLTRATIAFVLVIAAYLAEVIRAGLQSVPDGQYEAAASLGLSFWPATILIALPQALRITIPALVSTFIAFFKDTSLVAIIGLFDLLGAARAVIVDPKWAGFGVEVYLFVAIIYFAFCYAMSRYSRHLETVLKR
jgi:general L-amino acid transport system permease protein